PPREEDYQELEADQARLDLPARRGSSVGEGAAGYAVVGSAYADLGAAPQTAPRARTARRPRRRVAAANSLPYTALCIEPRDGKLYVFMPLLGHLDHYAQLLGAIEATAAELKLPVLIEGYDPPRHPALRSLKVTPDPGVIEVNIHPAANWEELEHNTVTLYEEARLSRLGAEKFMLDGRHTGTGGGNHVTLGGPTVDDSPFLRRPDLLRSLITYWQHHPSLSYLFSGMFIGSTSQAPRVDERGSHELRELERSFAEIEQGVPPGIVDRALRTFLTDLTGNTHRAEFCIDKLFSFDSSAGRQGLLEFRGFEMPPHARMSLAQMSLLRALVVRFWKQPYRHPLVRWGTALHDRFMLPEAIWTDLGEVIADFDRAGYPFRLEWFAPFHEFRFPVYGRAEYDGIQLELRAALEPWLVLGEEATAQRQARIVDSAVERLQVKCRGFDPTHYVLTCNGRPLPLQPTGQPNEFYAGVRYKAWKAIFGLQPTVEMHAPIVVDVFDRRLGRSIGGCVYHVNHPGGRAYDTFPVNAYEAESRRFSRFWAWGHTAGETPAPA
ncbi:MAG TPA: transglutaminase family protein, partial [Polyangiales bacterium]